MNKTSLVITPQVPFQKELTEFEHGVVETAFKQLFKKPYFDICIINNILGILDIKQRVQETGDYKTLHALHCVHWEDMRPAVLHGIEEKCFSLIGAKYISQRTAYAEEISPAGVENTSKAQATPQPQTPPQTQFKRLLLNLGINRPKP